MTLVVRPLVPSDWSSVAAIYAAGIITGTATFETRLPAWEDWDAAHLPACRLAARDGEQVVGWAALSPVSRRECYRGVAEISIYVAEDWRGRGVGRALLDSLVSQAEEHGIWTLQASTFPENVASLRLQTSCGFRIVGRREQIAQLHGVWRDTILTERRSRRIGMSV
jgi:L-amino acid N-acyltransferase YncA